MIKGVFLLLKKIVLAALLIYSFDVFTVALNLSIPINWLTILLVGLFEIPGLICLVLFSLTF